MWEHLLDFTVTSAALLLPMLACASFLYERSWCDRSFVLFGSVSAVALAGYLAFWAWFANPALGIAWTVLTLAASTVVIWRRRRQALVALRDDDVWVPLLLTFLVGVLYIGLLHLYRTNLRIDLLAAARYMVAMPADNELPRRFAERLILDVHPPYLFGEWLTSDRPPLQVGLLVLNAPIARAIGAPLAISEHAAGLWFQLSWLAAMWALLRRLGFDVRYAAVLAAVTAIAGLTMFHSIFVWPKLGGGAFGVAAFAFYARPGARGVATVIGVAALMALAWLAHGATVYALLALGLMGLFWKPRPSFGAAAAGLATFLALALPWTAYQKFYDPPGDRLVKWHLADVMAVDDRSVLQALKDQYRLIGWSGAVKAKIGNFLTLTHGWGGSTFALNYPKERRTAEWYFFFRSVSVWNIALLALPLALLRRRRRAGPSGSMIAAAFIWFGLTLIAWCLIAWGPPIYTFNHQGSLAANLTLFALAYALAWRASPRFLGALAVASVVTSAITWIPPTELLSRAPVSQPAVAVAILSALVISGFLAWFWRTRRSVEIPE